MTDRFAVNIKSKASSGVNNSGVSSDTFVSLKAKNWHCDNFNQICK